MALYSDTIDINTKWMWSSITTGVVGTLFLAGAFWGISSSINSAPTLYIGQSVPFIQPVETQKPVPAQPSVAVKIKPSDQKVNRATKQDATFNKKPAITVASKPKAPTPSVTAIDNKSAAQPSAAKIISQPIVKPIENQQSNLTKKTLSLTQLASLEIDKPATNKTATAVAPELTVDKPIAPFKKTDVSIKVKKGDTLLKILKQNGATSTEAQNIVNKLKPHVKINALEIGQPLTLTLDRRTNNNSIHPVKLVVPLGYRAIKPDAELKEQVSIAYNSSNKLVINLPENELTAITMRPSKPLKAPKYVAPQKALDKKSTDALSTKIASLSTPEKTTAVATGKSRQAYYRTRSSVKSSFKKTVAAQGVPKDVQTRLISVYNQTAKSKKVKKGDLLEIFYDQTESASGKLQKLGKLLYVNFKAYGKNYTYYRFGSQFYDSTGKSISASNGGILARPVFGARISGVFGMRRHPVYKRWKMHSGTDFAAPRGTPIYAASAGKIEIAKWYGGAGRYVQINHQNGYKTGYMHMSRFAKGMKPGRTVKRGQIIGYVGSTGTATGNHLHFNVIKNGKKVNPMKYIGGGNGSSKLTGSQLAKFKKEKNRILGKLNQTKSTTKIARK